VSENFLKGGKSRPNIKTSPFLMTIFSGFALYNIVLLQAVRLFTCIGTIRRADAVLQNLVKSLVADYGKCNNLLQTQLKNRREQ
jgi:hypothetical protein